ncbi:MAG: methyltransferase domain-containing protein [Ignavibacteriae bacterium]|nr:MAG: methyltransferase domain-containing protein [Ignavibacteriota bacterium]
MENPEEIKSMIKERYTEIANQSKEKNESSCCGTGCCTEVDYAVFAEDYKKLEGYNPDADLGLGCGVPTEFAQIKKGDTVIDLGSGAGNDAFVARAIAGESGKVIGVDMTEAMIEKARTNNDKLGFNNVEFRLGDIERMPITANTADVIISNCVLNLVPDKKKAFAEIYRVMKPGGHLSVSDIVIKGALPKVIQSAAEMYVGCVGGAIEMDEYISAMEKAGLTNIKIQKERVINLPDEILLQYINKEALAEYKSSGTAVLSINVYAEKPEVTQKGVELPIAEKKEACCGPDCCS